MFEFRFEELFHIEAQLSFFIAFYFWIKGFPVVYEQYSDDTYVNTINKRIKQNPSYLRIRPKYLFSLVEKIKNPKNHSLRRNLLQPITDWTILLFLVNCHHAC